MSFFANTGLVLEGGGMRCVFTAGVLDFLMDHHIRFPYTIGVSAGASNGISYLSGQRGRSRYSNIDLLKEYNYMGIHHFLKGKGYINLDFLFYTYPEKYYPFNYNRYFASKERFVVVTSNCLTGQAVYFEEKKDPERLLAIVRASCSLPFVCPITYVDEIPMLDGGVCDAIPIQRAISDGYEKNVIVLTRPKGYRKKNKPFRFPSFLYKQFPEFQKQFKQKYFLYNEVLDFIDQLENEGKAIVIRPDAAMNVDRMERNLSKLSTLYDHGYACAEKILKSVE